MLKTMSVLACLLLLQACSTTKSFDTFDRENPDFKLAADDQLCFMLQSMSKHKNELELEIKERDLLSNSDWLSIEAKDLKLAESKCAVLGILGPNYSHKSLTKLNSYGDNESSITYSCSKTVSLPNCPATTFIFINEKVVNIK